MPERRCECAGTHGADLAQHRGAGRVKDGLVAGERRVRAVDEHLEHNLKSAEACAPTRQRNAPNFEAKIERDKGASIGGPRESSTKQTVKEEKSFRRDRRSEGRRMRESFDESKLMGYGRTEGTASSAADGHVDGHVS
eukprot:4113005-Pleurochrysis_carterae.AAC.1